MCMTKEAFEAQDKHWAAINATPEAELRAQWQFMVDHWGKEPLQDLHQIKRALSPYIWTHNAMRRGLTPPERDPEFEALCDQYR